LEGKVDVLKEENKELISEANVTEAKLRAYDMESKAPWVKKRGGKK